MFNYDDDFDYGPEPNEEPHREHLNYPQVKRKSFDFGNCVFFITSLKENHWVDVWLPDTGAFTENSIYVAPYHTNATIVEAFSLIITTEQVREVMDYLRGQ